MHPAALKAFFRTDLSLRLRDDERGAVPLPLLTGKSARSIVTMGMPAFIYRWWFGAAMRALETSLLGLAGIRPQRRTIIGGLGALTREKAAAHLKGRGARPPGRRSSAARAFFVSPAATSVRAGDRPSVPPVSAARGGRSAPIWRAPDGGGNNPLGPVRMAKLSSEVLNRSAAPWRPARADGEHLAAHLQT